ncbi:hypothetical protein JQC67_10595 [Aurantibacter crassamenti]|uniref:hypothetical protein n=1 Tax=Aurantibacter crassamenti TaxID=1837375 RepID=UPI00193A3769|nr:hypothetical protein [Aurantibacter crassamenti]MBM1106587.1 hypothetical protein [Aurantibacter crassamenti]
MKNAGIWLDKEKAHIITVSKDNETFKTINSDLEFFNPKGGSGTAQKGGPQDVVQDCKYLEREKQQLKKYFHAIAIAVTNADKLVIFGPAGTNNKLREELELSFPELAARVKKVIKADSMTDNQVKALVRDFYYN